MGEQYRIIKSFQEIFDDLFQSLGIKIESIEIKEQSIFTKLVTKIRGDNSMDEYLCVLESRLKEAKRLIDEKMADANSNIQRLEELEKELAKQKSFCQKLEREKEQCRKRTEEEIQLRKEKGLLLDEAKKAADDAYKEHLQLIRSLIDMRDNLLLKRDWIRENNFDDGNMNKLVESQYRETGKILQKSGVEVLEDSGRFDISRQTVVETRPTEDLEKVDHIAEIYRPGYLYKGEVLRGQEIVLFTKADAE